jgi:hypothetical protein
MKTNLRVSSTFDKTNHCPGEWIAMIHFACSLACKYSFRSLSLVELGHLRRVSYSLTGKHFF